MSASEYEALGCEILGLVVRPDPHDTPDDALLAHFYGRFRLLDNPKTLKSITRARLRRVIGYARKTEPPHSNADKAVKDRHDEWCRRIFPHLFLSYADYELAARRTERPPTTPNQNEEYYHEVAILQFHRRHFQRARHTPDIDGYRNYIRDTQPRLYRLLTKRLPAVFPEEPRKKHTYVVGTIGSGKTELLKIIAYNYLSSDHAGVVLLDPAGDVALQIAQWADFVGSDRLIYIDPYLHPEMTPVLNPFLHKDLDEQGKRLLIQEILIAIVEILKGDLGGSLSLNMKVILRPCIAVLLDTPGATFRDLRRFMNDEENEDLYARGCEHPNEDFRAFFLNDFNSNARC